MSEWSGDRLRLPKEDESDVRLALEFGKVRAEAERVLMIARAFMVIALAEFVWIVYLLYWK